MTTDKDKELVLPVQSMQSALISDAPVKCTFIACCNLRIKSKTCFLKEKKNPKTPNQYHALKEFASQKGNYLEKLKSASQVMTRG